MEVVNYATYAQPTVLFDTMGFGKALDSKPLLLLPGRAVVRVGRRGEGARGRPRRRDRRAPRSARTPARAARHRSRLRRRRSRARPRRCASRCRASSTARSRIVLEHVTRLADDLCPDWPQPVGHSGYRVIVTGNPTYTCDVQMMGDDGDHNTGGLVGTAARLTNAIPAVCAAPAGPAVGARPAPDPGSRTPRPLAVASIVTVTLLGGSGARRLPMVRAPVRAHHRRRPPPPVLQTLLPPTRLRIPPPGRRAGPRRARARS